MVDEIGLHGLDRGAQRANFLRRRFDFRLVGGDHQIVPVPGADLCEFAADAAGGAGDDGKLSAGGHCNSNGFLAGWNTPQPPGSASRSRQLSSRRVGTTSVVAPFTWVQKGDEKMKALAWHGKDDIRCETVPDPKIQHGRDAIIKVTACAICGSDLHIFDGVIPAMERATSSATRPWARSSKSAPATRS